jgi:hypothetical protein
MPEDRAKAERAIELYMSGDSGDLDWPPCSSRIREARLQAGLTSQETADRLRIPLAAYDDLERYDDEAFTAAKLGTLCSLGQLVGVSPAQLLLGDDGECDRHVSFEEISKALRRHLASQSMTVRQFSDSVGWDVRGLLENPANWRNEPVELLYEVCRRLKVDWVTALETESES